MIDFALSPEHAELLGVVRDFLTKRSPQAAVRRTMSTSSGYDDAVWRQMATELGLQGIAVPVEHGGSGFTLREVGVVLEEMGRALLCSPFLSTVVLAANALRLSGDEDAQLSLLPQIAAGELIATVAYLDDPAADGPGTSAVRTEGGWALSGVKSFVLDGSCADVLVVSAATEHGPALFLVDGCADGVQRTPLEVLDETRRQSRVAFAAAAGRLLGRPGDAERVIAEVESLAAACLSAELVGVAGKALDLAVEYARTRHQFGRPIGSFQAVKHRCADMLIRVESARSAATWAMWTAEYEPQNLPVAAALANAYCSEAALFVTGECIQIHGGIGFAWEYPAQLYYKRALSAKVMFGTPAVHRRRLASLLGV